MRAPVADPWMSEAEYLAMERASSTKHELWNGEMFAMTGGTLSHATLAMNMGALLYAAVRGRCRVLSSDAKIHVPLSRGFVYPDVSVVCGDMQTYEGSDDVLCNPLLVVEVLSPTAERFDRGDKFAGYRSIPSLADYVMVTQEIRQVEVFSRRPDESWLLRAVGEMHRSVTLPSLGVELLLDDVYRGVIDLPAVSV